MPILPPLEPFFKAIISGESRPDPRPVAEVRAAMHAMIEQSFSRFVPPRDPLPHEQDHMVPVEGGEIRVRIYRPEAGDRPLPCHINLHGGGFWLGTIEHGDASCRAMAMDAGCVVVSVDYRLAPEHQYPLPLEDCYRALEWVSANAGMLAIDPDRISIGGGSAGGNLAAAVCLLARDRGGPMPVLQLLEIPVTDLTRLEPLRVEAEGLVVPSGKEDYRAKYLADLSQATEPLASPLLAPDLSGLPPALVIVAEYDPLRPEGEAYARRLREAGVPVELVVEAGQFHGSQRMGLLIPDEVAEHDRRTADALRHAYGTA